MKEPKWLTARMVHVIHQEAVEQFGGLNGVRDEGLLESALNKPRQRFAYVEAATLFELAASLCEGIALNRPFLDGNKRTSLLSARAFLYLNGWAFDPDESDEVEIMVAFATRQVTTEFMANWFREHSKRHKGNR
jgi:death-on-curing protein